MPTISNAELQLINMLESNTGAHAKDVVMTDESVIFVVEKGELGKAIGKGGNNIRRMRHAFKRNVEVVEAADDLRGFLANIFKPVKLVEVQESTSGDRKVASISVNNKDKALAIGRAGERIKKARALAKREFGCDDVRII